MKRFLRQIHHVNIHCINRIIPIICEDSNIMYNESNLKLDACDTSIEENAEKIVQIVLQIGKLAGIS